MWWDCRQQAASSSRFPFVACPLRIPSSLSLFSVKGLSAGEKGQAPWGRK